MPLADYNEFLRIKNNFENMQSVSNNEYISNKV